MAGYDAYKQEAPEDYEARMHVHDDDYEIEDVPVCSCCYVGQRTVHADPHCPVHGQEAMKESA